MDELDGMGPVLLPEEEAKQLKKLKPKRQLPKWPFSRKRTFITTVAIAVVAMLGVMGYKVNQALYKPDASSHNTANAIGQGTKVNQSKTISGLQLSPRLTYGNKYAKGVLPVGDQKFVTDAPKKGYVYLCNANFANKEVAGAQLRGPWFVNNNTEWDSTKKPFVAGSISWAPKVTNTITSGKRVIATNGYPTHHTGLFPVAANDPAHKYDANPNPIKEQTLSYELNAGPGSGTTYCMGGESGIMLTGVPLFNAFDAGGRDAGAWEVQDSCDGHPQMLGEYHYHNLSRCIVNSSVREVIGFALDGYAITGPKIDDSNILTTENLDDCHGIVSEIILDNAKVTTYHYVMTQDFPYSVSCFRSKPTKAPGFRP